MASTVLLKNGWQLAAKRSPEQLRTKLAEALETNDGEDLYHEEFRMTMQGIVAARAKQGGREQEAVAEQLLAERLPRRLRWLLRTAPRSSVRLGYVRWQGEASHKPT